MQDITKYSNVKFNPNRGQQPDVKDILALFAETRPSRAIIFWSSQDLSAVLTYRRCGVGLSKADSFRLDGCLVLLDQWRWWCQRSRLVAPMLPKSTCTAVQADAWQLDEHRVAQLKVKDRLPALNWSHRREEATSMNNNRAGPITRRQT